MQRVHNGGAVAPGPRLPGYSRDAFTWVAFGALGGFGILNALLGPTLPYLRAAENLSYVAGVAHQAAFGVGGGLAGLIASRVTGVSSRALVIRVGLAMAALAGLGIGFGGHLAISISAALCVSLFGTSALIRLWAALSDAHTVNRAVAMTEGEVSVSLGGILAPLLISGLATTVLGWRFAFVATAVLVAIVVAISAAVCIPSPAPVRHEGPVRLNTARAEGWAAPALVVVLAVVGLEFSLSFWLASYLNDDVGLTRATAAAMVAGLYAANLTGRLIASRLARHTTATVLLAASIGLSLAGLPLLLAATGATVAALGIVVVGAGIGAMFPLTSAMHVAASERTADAALGQVLAVAALGQVLAPTAVAVIAQYAGLRIGLLVLPVLLVLSAGLLALHHTRAHGLPPR